MRHKPPNWKPFTMTVEVLSTLAMFLILIRIAVSSRNEPTEEYTLSCNPSTKHLFGKFFVQRFFDAREELKLEDWSSKQFENPSEYASIVEHVLIKFFSCNSGTLVYYRRNQKPIIYSRIWKCANEGIGMNLHQITVADRTPLSKGMVHEVKTQAALQEILKTMHREGFLNSTESNVFTFVREPFSKFISGFTESVFRTSPRKTLRRPSEIPMILNISTAKKYLEMIFDCKAPLVQLDHIYPISGSLFEYNVKVVGHLETFLDDWNRLVKPLYNIQRPYNERHGFHPTSEIHPRNKNNPNKQQTDPSHVRPTLRALFEREINYKRALCHFLLIDYVCLPEYPLPVDCLFLNATLHLAREALLSRREIPPCPSRINS